MNASLALLMVSVVGIDLPPAPGNHGKIAAKTAVQAEAIGSPLVRFEVRDITAASPEWRGRMMTRLQPLARREGATVWALNGGDFKELLNLWQSDARFSLVRAPVMNAQLGKPARIVHETTHKYVASLKRKADGPPGQATKLAFEPQVDEVHDGIRVHILSSRLKGQALFARVVIEENRLVAMHTSDYQETLKETRIVEESHPGKGFLHDRLHRNIGIGRQAINAQFQIPEVETRRIDGEWLIPSDGVLLVSLGPSTQGGGPVVKRAYQERVIAISARPAAQTVASNR
jgi:hypothetical protein